MRTGPGFWTEELRPAPPLETLTRAVAAIPWSILLASGGKAGGRSRHMFAAFDPFLVVEGASSASQGAPRLEWRGDAAAIANATGDASAFEAEAAAATRGSAPSGIGGSAAPADPTELLRALLAAYPVPVSPAHPPFTGGLAGWFGYDLARAFERLPARAPDPLALPCFALGLFDLVIAIDRLTRKATLIATGYPEREPSRRARRAEARIAWLLERLDGIQRTEPDAPRSGILAAHGVESNLARDDYIEAVRRVKNYIRAGDIFQANVTQRSALARAAGSCVVVRRSARAESGRLRGIHALRGLAAARRGDRSGGVGLRRLSHRLAVTGEISARFRRSHRDAADQGDAAARRRPHR